MHIPSRYILTPSNVCGGSTHKGENAPPNQLVNIAGAVKRERHEGENATPLGVVNRNLHRAAIFRASIKAGIELRRDIILLIRRGRA